MKSHPNLSPQINKAIAQSEADGGVFLKTLEADDVVTVTTRNSTYTITVIDGPSGTVMIGGGSHIDGIIPATISGSTWGSSMLKMGFIGKGMRLEVWSDTFTDGILTTSTIERIDVKTKTLNYEVKQELLN